MFNGKDATVSFYVSNTNQSVLGIDAISALHFTSFLVTKTVVLFMNVMNVTAGDQSIHVAKCDSASKIRMLRTAPPSIVQRVCRLSFPQEEKVEREIRQMAAGGVIEEVVSTYILRVAYSHRHRS